MKSWRAHKITAELRKHDRELYCNSLNETTLAIFRKSSRLETYWLDSETCIHNLRASPHFVCALTDNWQANGLPVEWGLEPIMKRIRENDLWSRDRLADELIESYEKKSESLKRDRINKIESLLLDNKHEIRDAFSNINVANLKKTYRERDDEKKAKAKGL